MDDGLEFLEELYRTLHDLKPSDPAWAETADRCIGMLLATKINELRSETARKDAALCETHPFARDH